MQRSKVKFMSKVLRESQQSLQAALAMTSGLAGILGAKPVVDNFRVLA